MKKHTIQINEKSYRVEINFSAVDRWEKLTGKAMSDFEQAAAQAAQASQGVATFDMFAWLFVAVQEGEELEGREFKTSYKDFTKECRPAAIARFTPLFLEMYMDKTATDIEVKKKKRSRLMKKLHQKLPTKAQRRWFWVLCIGMNAALIAAALRWFGLCFV